MDETNDTSFTWNTEPITSLLYDPVYALMLQEGSISEEELNDLTDERLGSRQQYNLRQELLAA
jgi:hypothetical protein